VDRFCEFGRKVKIREQRTGALGLRHSERVHTSEEGGMPLNEAANGLFIARGLFTGTLR
jgi:hypothetical protein